MALDKNPLTEAVFFILLSLVKPCHGYGIMQFSSEMSNGRVSLGAGTVYGALNTLMDKNWITVEASSEADKRKKLYVITPLGLAILEQEIERLKELIKVSQMVLEEI